MAPGFGGINLEDISAPRCFEIEERLKETLDIPVFHDDQHGTAIVVLEGNRQEKGRLPCRCERCGKRGSSYHQTASELWFSSYYYV